MMDADEFEAAFEKPAASRSRAEDWPELIPLGSLSEPPEFPTDGLPAVVCGMVREIAAARQVPEDLAAVTALGVLAACGAGRYRVAVDENYSEPLNLYIVSAMESGERKSGTFEDITAPLLDAEIRLKEEAAPRIAEAREKRSIEEERLKRLRQDAARLHPPDSENAAADACELAKKLTEVPPEPRLIVGDATPERVAAMLEEQGERLAIVDPEGSCVFGILAGRYSSDGKSRAEVFLRAHAGEAFNVDRQSRPSVSLRHPALTLISTTQPVVIRELAEEPGFRERGVLARLLFALPATRVGTRLYQRHARNESVRAAYGRLVVKLALEGARLSDVTDLKLSPGAFEVWKSEYNRVEPSLKEGESLQYLRAWGSKLSGAVARIAGVLHLAATTATQPEKVSISAETMRAAVRIGQYFEAHALAAFGMMDELPCLPVARKVLRWIERGKRARFTLRDCYMAVSTAKSPDEVAPALRILEERSYIRQEEVEGVKRERGRPRSPAYLVNPLLGKSVAQRAQTPQNRASAVSATTSRRQESEDEALKSVTLDVSCDPDGAYDLSAPRLAEPAAPAATSTPEHEKSPTSIPNLRSVSGVVDPQPPCTYFSGDRGDPCVRCTNGYADHLKALPPLAGGPKSVEPSAESVVGKAERDVLSGSVRAAGGRNDGR
jgi:hypothetical protein